MAKRLQEYMKYTLKELESYTKQEGSCVRKVNSNLHLSLRPYCVADFKHALHSDIMRRKVGYYDVNLHGIVLDIKNIKVLGTAAVMRADDPRLHLDVNADCYVFQPVARAILSGVVKHVGNHHIGVIIYRVFNVSIRLAGKLNKEQIKMDDTVQFRIKNFNLQNVFPYIEGDLVTENGDTILDKFIKIEPGSGDSNHDSGIEERENHNLDQLETSVKEERTAEYEETFNAFSKSSKKKGKDSATKRKQKVSLNEISLMDPPIIKVESDEEDKDKNAASENTINNYTSVSAMAQSKKRK
ncbi:DNA-directed RNA polymerase I subunit RPA43-like [Eurosta solidaginis]|uniref:DNA-directed RNA polymerase I subunit RPA43-like n=1 Tax=Eurosta solidaginis TaxID=178769 RepID=UPI003530E3C4